MTKITRRSFTKKSLAILGGATLMGKTTPAWAADSGKGPVIGKIIPKSSKQIAASPFGVGFETLDRKLFNPKPTYDRLEKLGIKWARVQSGWSRCENTKGKYDFAWLDEVVDTLLNLGIQPWMNITYGNKLYMPTAPNRFAMGWAPVTDVAKAGWLNFVQALTEHYRGRIQHWEIWNEPNGLWSPRTPSPTEYTEMVKKTSPVIRAAIPDAVVIAGALANTNHVAFLQGCMDAGMADYVDRVSVHLYNLIPESMDADVKKMRAMMTQHKPSLDLWQGEAGQQSQPGMGDAKNQLPWTELLQARWLLRRMINDKLLKIEQTSWFNVADLVNYASSWSGPDSKPKNANQKADPKKSLFHGLLHAPSYTPKLSYFAYQNLCTLFDSQTETGEVPMQFAGNFTGSDPAISAEQIRQAGFVRAGQPMATYWLPVDVFKNMPTQAVDVTMTMKNNMALQNPVLVNLLNGEVSKLEGKQSGNQWKFAALPLTDYPMLITDASVALPG